MQHRICVFFAFFKINLVYLNKFQLTWEGAFALKCTKQATTVNKQRIELTMKCLNAYSSFERGQFRF